MRPGRHHVRTEGRRDGLAINGGNTESKSSRLSVISCSYSGRSNLRSYRVRMRHTAQSDLLGHSSPTRERRLRRGQMRVDHHCVSASCRRFVRFCAVQEYVGTRCGILSRTFRLNEVLESAFGTRHVGGCVFDERGPVPTSGRKPRAIRGSWLPVDTSGGRNRRASAAVDHVGQGTVYDIADGLPSIRVVDQLDDMSSLP